MSTDGVPARVRAAEARREMRELIERSSLGSVEAVEQRKRAGDLGGSLEVMQVELSFDEWRDVVRAIDGCSSTEVVESEGVNALLDSLAAAGLLEQFEADVTDELR